MKLSLIFCEEISQDFRLLI